MGWGEAPTPKRTKVENAMWLTNEEERTVADALSFVIDQATASQSIEVEERLLARMRARTVL